MYDNNKRDKNLLRDGAYFLIWWRYGLSWIWLLLSLGFYLLVLLYVWVKSLFVSVLDTVMASIKSVDAYFAYVIDNFMPGLAHLASSAFYQDRFFSPEVSVVLFLLGFFIAAALLMISLFILYDKIVSLIVKGFKWMIR